jgi:toluene monooxygenase system ferredoxin subunit
VPLDNARFDGVAVVCGFHPWRFDACTGQGVRPAGCALKPYALRLDGGELQVELG